MPVVVVAVVTVVAFVEVVVNPLARFPPVGAPEGGRDDEGRDAVG